MIIKKIKYEEFNNSSRYWKLEECEFKKTNLIVGKNSTGKSRLINLIAALANLITGKKPNLYKTGSWEIEIASENESLRYELKIEDSFIVSENLKENGETKFHRKGSDGEIWYAGEGKFIKIAMPENQIIPASRRDELQHPFISKLYNWANRAEQHLFGSDYGRNELITGEKLNSLMNSLDEQELDLSSPTITYIKGYKKFKEKFDEAIIRDMAKLGYHLEDVCCQKLEIELPGINSALFGLCTKETENKTHCEQFNLSQGQFRALALIIHLNYLKMNKSQRLMLIDDVGEGLDYERSAGMIDILTTAAQNSEIQIIMTSNDKFVMNKVPLENWIILKRDGCTVNNFTSKNSKEKFEDFKFMGLNNFDIFSSDFL